MFGGLAHRSFLFWPVGCGDTTTVVINDAVVMQIDLNDGAIAESDDNERIPVIDELAAKLPRRNGKPYLSCLALTHPDLDHCKGIADLLKRIVVGELWHTPRIFREYHADLSDDAKAFRKEAKRRVAATIRAAGDPGPGNRVRVIGYDQLLQEDDYRGFPMAYFTSPGNSIELLDCQNLAASFSAFVHAPFKDNSAGERNETSLALQIALIDGPRAIRGLFLGDLAYTTLRRVVDETKNHGNHVKLVWNALLAPHHCSKKAMYEKDANGNDVLRQDILDDFEAAQVPGAFIIASSPAIPSRILRATIHPTPRPGIGTRRSFPASSSAPANTARRKTCARSFCRSRPTAVSSRAGPSSFRKKPGRALRPQWRKHAATVPRQRPRSASGAHDHGGPTVGPVSASGDQQGIE